MTSSPYAGRPWLQHYDYWVPPHLVYPARPLHDILDAAALDVPDRPATAFLGATLTFHEIKDRSDRLATVLAHLDVVKGDRVGIMLPNCPQYVIATFAILRLGAVVVNINPTYTAREIQTIAADAGVRVLVTLDTLAPLALDLRKVTPLERVIITSVDEYSGHGAGLPRIDGTITLAHAIAGVAAPEIFCTSIEPDDVAVLQYTGGTAGAPKGAMLTHRNIFANVVQTEAFLYRSRTRGESRYLMVIPFFHIYAFTVGMMNGIWVGALQILIPKYDPALVLTAIRDFRPTYFPAVPTIFMSLLQYPKVKEHGLENVRTFNTGGAPCSVDVIEQWERTFGRPLNQGYGLSETSPVTHSTPQLARRKPGTIGLPLPDTDIRIVDLETGDRDLPVGEAGELCISGPQVMKGYWRQPEESARSLRADADGRVWFHTGDIARMDDEGYTTIVQRKKDMIIVDGFNVYPSEIEAVIHEHPAVQLVAVVGMPDAYHGESVRACVVLKEGDAASETQILEHCRLHLAPYKVPSRIELRHTLPTSAVGKVLYRVLREETAATTTPAS